MPRLAALAFALACVAAARAEEAPKVAWIQDDWDKAVAEAKKSGKLIQMNFHADW
jgi:hypothetical protein